jgi:hypothetical protein
MKTQKIPYIKSDFKKKCYKCYKPTACRAKPHFNVLQKCYRKCY